MRCVCVYECFSQIFRSYERQFGWSRRQTRLISSSGSTSCNHFEQSRTDSGSRIFCILPKLLTIPRVAQLVARELWRGSKKQCQTTSLSGSHVIHCRAMHTLQTGTRGCMPAACTRIQACSGLHTLPTGTRGYMPAACTRTQACSGPTHTADRYTRLHARCMYENTGSQLIVSAGLHFLMMYLIFSFIGLISELYTV